VDAPVTVKGVDANRVMETPDGPWVVAWYDFSAQPGQASNAVFAGHYDFHDVGPAVFWNLKLLVPGDIVEVYLSDGRSYRYSVISSTLVDAASRDIAQYVGATATETITLITPGGIFDRTIGQYDKRLIVRAQLAGS
jgi:sortase (surface protein transpeptidase)